MSIQPTRRVALVAAVLALGLLLYPGRDVPVLASVGALAGALLLLVLLDGWLGTSPAQVVVSRQHPPVVVAGSTATLRWEIRSESRRGLRIEAADELAPSLRAGSRRFTVRVPAGDVARVATTIRPMRRGRFPLEHLTLRIHGRLGLASRQRDVPLRSVVRVHPVFHSRAEAEIQIRRARILELGMRSARGFGGGTEFEQLREYAPDDEFRHIDWTATARTGRTIVRTYRAERNQSVLILLDNGRTMAARVAAMPRVEHAMDAAMMLTAVATGLGDRCGLLAYDREVRAVVPPARRADQLGRVTEAMYSLEPELFESDHSGAFAEVVARFRRRAMIVLLTDLVDGAVEDSLLPALPILVRTHLVVVAGVRDPQVERWANDPLDDHDEADPEAAAYRRAAAIASLDQRRRTVARLRGRGVTVIDAEPGRLARELADAYLTVKNTGRL
jgi:uncharacterized protein (DUF58 family)